MSKERKLFCPRCRSVDISWDLSKEAIVMGTFQNRHKCNNCGYTGIFPEKISKQHKSK